MCTYISTYIHAYIQTAIGLLLTLQGDVGGTGDEGDAGDKGEPGFPGPTGEQGLKGAKVSNCSCIIMLYIRTYCTCTAAMHFTNVYL